MSWENRHVKTIVAIPHSGGEVYMDWSIAFTQAMINAPPNTFMMTAPEPQIDVAREKLCEIALSNGASQIFFLDADTIPPKDVIKRLMRHKLPIVSGLYARRHYPCHNLMMLKAKDDKGNEGFTSIPEGAYIKEELVQCDAVGFGCVLIQTDVLKDIEKPWFAWTEHKSIRGMCVLPGQHVYGSGIVDEVTNKSNVVTSNGIFGKPEYLSYKMWKGDACVISPKVMRLPIAVTPEHKIFIKRTIDEKPIWMNAGDIKEGYYGCFPIPKKSNDRWIRRIYLKQGNEPDIDLFKRSWKKKAIRINHGQNWVPNYHYLTEELGELLGWYIAEGSAIETDGKIAWSLGISDKERSYCDKIIELNEKVFNLSSNIHKCEHSIEVVMKNKTLSYIFRDWFGVGARNKKIPMWMYQATLPFTKAVLRGIWNGDGYETYSGLSKVPMLGINIGSNQLALDICSMLLKLGIKPHLASYVPDKAFTKKPMYHVRVYGDDYRKLAECLGREPKYYKGRWMRKAQSFISDGMYWMPLKVGRTPYSGPVYDLMNVSNGASYVLGNLTVHNSEDFFFCERARRAGYKVFVDTSIVCRHMGPIKILPSVGAQGLYEHRSGAMLNEM